MHRLLLLAQSLLRRLAGKMRLPHPEFDPIDVSPLHAEQLQHEFVVVRPQPIPEEARRHREVDAIVIEAFKLDPPKPAGEDIFAQLCTQPALDPSPGFA